MNKEQIELTIDTIEDVIFRDQCKIEYNARHLMYRDNKTIHHLNSARIVLDALKVDLALVSGEETNA